MCERGCVSPSAGSVVTPTTTAPTPRLQDTARPPGAEEMLGWGPFDGARRGTHTRSWSGPPGQLLLSGGRCLGSRGGSWGRQATLWPGVDMGPWVSATHPRNPNSRAEAPWAGPRPGPSAALRRQTGRGRQHGEGGSLPPVTSSSAPDGLALWGRRAGKCARARGTVASWGSQVLPGACPAHGGQGGPGEGQEVYLSGAPSRSEHS